MHCLTVTTDSRPTPKDIILKLFHILLVSLSFLSHQIITPNALNSFPRTTDPQSSILSCPYFSVAYRKPKDLAPSILGLVFGLPIQAKVATDSVANV